MREQARPEKESKMFHMQRRQQLRLISLCSAIIMSHTGTSYLEETLFKQQHFKSPFFMVLVMCVLYSLFFVGWKFGFSEDKALLPPSLGPGGDRSTRIAMAFLCVSYAMANSLTKLSLQFVSVPTQIVFKSCKLVAVMLGSTVILGKSYSIKEYLIALALVAGMVSFALADLTGSSAASLTESSDMTTIIGLSILLLALCFDSVLGNLQEKMQKGHICDENVLMYVQSISSAGLITVYTFFSGELQQGLTHCWTDSKVFFCLSAWGVLNIVGTIALLKVAGEFSAVTAVLTAFMRKFSSLIFSYMLYPKPFNIGHSMGLVLVFGAVGMHAYHKQHKKAPGISGEGKAPAAGLKALHGAEKATDEEMGGLVVQQRGAISEHNVRTGLAVAPPSPQRSPPSSQTPPSPVLRSAHPLEAPIRSG